MKYIKNVILLFLCVFVLAESAARYFGLHQYPLFVESSEFEFIHKPNQATLIYRNKFLTNEYSMRSKQITKNDTSVVLLLGDSVVNGGNTIDQDELASTILENTLTEKMGRSIRVLNISSYSWGPDNIYAYLKKYGTFNANLMIYVCNSNDAVDHMTFGKIVGTSNMHPNKNNVFGVSKLFEKGLNYFKGILDRASGMYQIKPKSLNKGISDLNNLNKGFSDLYNLSNKLNVPLLVYMHPDVEEIINKQYSSKGQSIIDFFKNKNVIILNELSLGIKKEYYKDNIHYNAEGQLFLSNNLFGPIHTYYRSLY